MKHSYTRIVSVLLAVLLTFGLMPAAVLAGPSTETILYAEVFVSYPLPGEHPKLSGVPLYETDRFTVDAVHFFELDDSLHPVGGFLPESYTFQPDRTYACQVILLPGEGWEFSATETWCSINRYKVQCDGVYPDGSACITGYLYCPTETVTVSFDGNGSTAPTPAPLRVPLGGRIWDVLRVFEDVVMPDQAHAWFMDWSEDPFATEWDGFYDFFSQVNGDMTLYAMWKPCQEAVEISVSLPPACLTEDDCSDPIVTVPARADYSAEGDHLYLPEDGHAPDFDSPVYLDFCWPYALEQGETYYGRAFVYCNVGAQPPAVTIHGAEFVSARKLDEYVLEVVYRITVSAGDSLRQAGVFIQTPRAGQSAMSAYPEVCSLTPGLEMSVWGWYTNQNLSGDWYEGPMEGGKTYYALVRINGGINYNISSSNLKLDVFGKNAKLVRMADLASSEGVPNLVGAVVAVTIPKTYNFTVDVLYGGGKFRSDRQIDRWVTIMDFADEEEGPITLTAKGDPTHMFNMWYDGNTYEVLSRNETYSFNLDRDVYIIADFVRKTPFVDVRAKDYFYEPVLWAIEHDPVITSGIDETHFGPKVNCTREQIVTFLWKACNAPEPVTTENPFTDVKPNKYYYKAVLWAVENGITSGVGDGKFGVGESCTRAQAMTFLWNSYGCPEPESTSCPFTDVKPGKYYYKAVLWALENGVTSGMSDTAFGTNSTCTRGQIITFLYKVYGPKG